jgi:hypothetical protein
MNVNCCIVGVFLCSLISHYMDTYDDYSCVLLLCVISGVDGTAALNFNADRINRWGLWSFSPGYTSYYQAMLVDLTKSDSEVNLI